MEKFIGPNRGGRYPCALVLSWGQPEDTSDISGMTQVTDHTMTQHSLCHFCELYSFSTVRSEQVPRVAYLAAGIGFEKYALRNSCHSPWLTLFIAKCIYARGPHEHPQSAHNIPRPHWGHDVQRITPEHPPRKCMVQGIPTFCQGSQTEGFVTLLLSFPKPHMV